MIIQYTVKLNEREQAKVSEICRALGRIWSTEDLLLHLLHTAHLEVTRPRDSDSLDTALLRSLKRAPEPMRVTDLMRRGPRAARKSAVETRAALSRLLAENLVYRVGVRWAAR